MKEIEQTENVSSKTNKIDEVGSCSRVATFPSSTTTSGFSFAPNLSLDTTVNKSYHSKSDSRLEILKPTIIDGVDPTDCIFCGFTTCIEFDLAQHLKEEHWMEMVELPIGKGKMPFRVAYAIDEGRSRFNPNLKSSETAASPNFDSLDSELHLAENRWIQANRVNYIDLGVRQEKQTPGHRVKIQ